MAIKKPIVDYNGKLSELQLGDTITGAGSGGGFTLSEIEINFGIKPIRSKRFTIVDAGVTNLSNIIIFPSGNTASGRGIDDWEWDSIQFAAKANTGNFTIYAHANGRIGGTRKIFYTIN